MVDKSQEERNKIVRKRMLDLTEASIVPMPQDSPWLRPFRMVYVQDGATKNWDLMRAHESVSIVVFNTTRMKLVFVRQFRPAAYYARVPECMGPIDVNKYPAIEGLTIELCAGIVDKDKPLVEIARDELSEEVGYEAPASAFSKIITYKNISKTATQNTLFYVEVTDDMHIHPGGGAESEGELIEVIEMTIQEARDYLKCEEVRSPAGCLLGIQWFLSNKAQQFEK